MCASHLAQQPQVGSCSTATLGLSGFRRHRAASTGHAAGEGDRGDERGGHETEERMNIIPRSIRGRAPPIRVCDRSSVLDEERDDPLGVGPRFGPPAAAVGRARHDPHLGPGLRRGERPRVVDRAVGVRVAVDRGESAPAPAHRLDRVGVEEVDAVEQPHRGDADVGGGPANPATGVADHQDARDAIEPGVEEGGVAGVADDGAEGVAAAFGDQELRRAERRAEAVEAGARAPRLHPRRPALDVIRLADAEGRDAAALTVAARIGSEHVEPGPQQELGVGRGVIARAGGIRARRAPSDARGRRRA